MHCARFSLVLRASARQVLFDRLFCDSFNEACARPDRARAPPGPAQEHLHCLSAESLSGKGVKRGSSRSSEYSKCARRSASNGLALERTLVPETTLIVSIRIADELAPAGTEQPPVSSAATRPHHNAGSLISGAHREFRAGVRSGAPGNSLRLTAAGDSSR